MKVMKKKTQIHTLQVFSPPLGIHTACTFDKLILTTIEVSNTIAVKLLAANKMEITF